MEEKNNPNAAGYAGALVGTLLGWGPLILPAIAGHEDAAVIALIAGALGCFFFGPILGIMFAEKISAGNDLPIFPSWFEVVAKVGGHTFILLLCVSALLYLLKY